MPISRPRPYTNWDWNEALNNERGVRGTHGLLATEQPEPTPDELNAVYSKGFIGASPRKVPQHERAAVIQAKASRVSLYEAFPWLKRGVGRGKKLMPYQASLSLDTSWGGDESQTTGSCVSHGCRNSAMCDYGVDVVFGETEWKGRICTENIYRHRGKNSQGWWCSAAASTIEVGGKGGLLYRKKYESPDGRDSVDLTRFSSRTEQWASNGSAGVPQWLRDIEDDNQAAFCIAITSIEEYLDAMYLGFGLNVCSGYGFSSSCDEYGFARQSGSWSHAMAHVGADDSEWAHQRYGDGIGLVMQSWGRWNNQDGRKCPDGFGIVPIGSFFASFKTIRKMIASDSYATCQVTGWDRRQPIQKYVQSSEFSDRIHERIKEREKAGSLLVA